MEIGIDEMRASTLEQLGLSISDANDASAVMAAALRRAASLLCPTSPVALISAVERSMKPLDPSPDRRQRCKDVLEDLIAHGDLMEFDAQALDTEHSPSSRRLLYLAPPSFVRLSDNNLLLLGVAPDAVDPLPEDLKPAVRGHLRQFKTDDVEGLCALLQRAGLYELPYSTWARAPVSASATEVVEQIRRVLDGARSFGEISGLRIFDTGISTRWYKDRWTNPGNRSGRFIARRPQTYGADLWCYAKLNGGVVERLLDLPQGRTQERGCDQAWRLQCALDAHRQSPQCYRVRVADEATVRMDIAMPCPAWLLRRWDCIGERVGNSTFSFLFAKSDVDEEFALLESQLWMIRAQ